MKKISPVKIISNNCIEIQDRGNTYLQSYDVIVAAKNIEGLMFIDKNYFGYSKTTSRHISNFFGMDSSEIKKNVASGDIKLTELNK